MRLERDDGQQQDLDREQGRGDDDDRASVASVRDMAPEQAQCERRQTCHQAQEAERERVMRQLVDLVAEHGQQRAAAHRVGDTRDQDPAQLGDP